MNEKEIKKYICIRCGNQYNEGESCQHCKKEAEVKNLEKKETEQCIENFEKIYNYVTLLMIAVGTIYLVLAIYLVIIVENVRIIVLLASILSFALYILICFITLNFIKWHKLMLKNLKEINNIYNSFTYFNIKKPE